MLLVDLHPNPAPLKKSKAFLTTHNLWFREGGRLEWGRKRRSQLDNDPITWNQHNTALDLLGHNPAAMSDSVSLAGPSTPLIATETTLICLLSDVRLFLA